MFRLALSFAVLVSISSPAFCTLHVTGSGSATANGLNQDVDFNVTITYSGSGENMLSSLTLGVVESSPSLTPIAGSGLNSSFAWDFGSGLTQSATSVSGANSFNHTIDTSGNQIFATLRFTLDASFTNGTIPIDLTFTNARQGGIPGVAMLASEFSVTGGNFVVVPEPSPLILLSFLGCAFGLSSIAAKRLWRHRVEAV
jgi:hypothetical protein